jgi:hypothetical protein
VSAGIAQSAWTVSEKSTGVRFPTASVATGLLQHPGVKQAASLNVRQCKYKLFPVLVKYLCMNAHLEVEV